MNRINVQKIGDGRMLMLGINCAIETLNLVFRNRRTKISEGLIREVFVYFNGRLRLFCEAVVFSLAWCSETNSCRSRMIVHDDVWNEI